jgi:hypothetical protein
MKSKYYLSRLLEGFTEYQTGHMPQCRGQDRERDHAWVPTSDDDSFQCHWCGAFARRARPGYWFYHEDGYPRVLDEVDIQCS